MSSNPDLIAISVGNTRVGLGRFKGGDLEKSAHFLNTDLPAVMNTVTTWWNESGKDASLPHLEP